MDQQPIACSNCKVIPFDILLLKCNHDLCVRCASERMSSQQVASQGKVFLQCEKCKQKTPLDEESVTELKSVINKMHMKSAKSFDSQKSERKQTTMNIRQAQQQNIQLFKPQQLNLVRTDISCQDHPEEQVMYYCFACKTYCFCADCVLTGQHMNHDVKVIKKAFKTIEGDLKKGLDEAKVKLKHLTEKRKETIGDINTMKNKTDKMKKAVENVFDEVRSVLRQKEQQYMKHFDKHLQKSLEVLNSHNKKILDERIKTMETFVKHYETNYRRGEISSINMWSKHEKDIQQYLSEPQPQLKGFSPDLEGEFFSQLSVIKENIKRLSIT